MHLRIDAREERRQESARQYSHDLICLLRERPRRQRFQLGHGVLFPEELEPLELDGEGDDEGVDEVGAALGAAGVLAAVVAPATAPGVATAAVVGASFFVDP
jgi:hypothetical protein